MSIQITDRRAYVRNCLLGPGASLHELAHVIVVHRYADVTLEPGFVRSHVRWEWDGEVPIWGLVFAYLAPLFVAGGLLVATAPFADTIATLLPWWGEVIVGVQFLFLTGPSALDISELMAVLTTEVSSA